MESLLRPGLRMWRNLAGKNTKAEQFLEQQYFTYKRIIGSRFEKKYSGENYTLFWSGSNRENRVGIYMKGSCDLPSVFTAVPAMQQALDGTGCIIREGIISHARSDIHLQTLKEWPEEWLTESITNLKLPPDYFQPRLFEKSFTVLGPRGPEEFPKKVIILSIASDVVRTVYQHREHGFLVDPGGWWLNQSMDAVLKDLDMATWFRENFVSLGKISVEASVENYTQIIKCLKSKTDAQILLFNVFTVEPSDLTHNYQFVRNPQSIRRREFNIAIAELSRQLDFGVVDLDKIFKKAGVREVQMDFAHFPLEVYPLVSQEVFRIMQELEIF